MRACSHCGKALVRRQERGHREREYCSDKCRQAAWRAKHKDWHKLKRILDASFERQCNAIEQNVHRESWQDDLELRDKLIEWKEKEIEGIKWELDAAILHKTLLQEEVKILKDQLADKETEIVRLQTLLNGQANRKR